MGETGGVGGCLSLPRPFPLPASIVPSAAIGPGRSAPVRLVHCSEGDRGAPNSHRIGGLQFREKASGSKRIAGVNPTFVMVYTSSA